MKSLFALLAILLAPLAFAGETSLKGQVLEVQDSGAYTYLRLKTKEGETWAAISKTPVKNGSEVTLENTMVMQNFESKSLKKTFPSIVFGTLGGTGTAAAMPAGHSRTEKPADIGDVRVAKATGANARTVAEIVTKAKELKDKPVLVRGKVVKYNAAIMGKNWLHLRDGSGSASDNSHDILVTTAQEAKVGEVVTVKGIVRTDKDFGSGYSYKVLVEEATLQR